MQLSSASGFSLTELVVAMVVMGIIAGAAYTLLDLGLRSFETADGEQDDVHALSRAMDVMRAEIGVASSFVSVNPDSLVLAMRDGSQVGYVRRDTIDGVALFRTQWQSGAWVESPGYPLARLRDGDSPAALDFSEPTSGRIEIAMDSARLSSTLSAARWTTGGP